jgi:hypothetical protein
VAIAHGWTSTVSELHACPHPECSRTIPSLMWACLEHWQGLPPPIRQGIWAATRTSGQGSLQLQNAEERAFAYWGTIERELRDLAAGEAPGGSTTAEPPRTIA